MADTRVVRTGRIRDSIVLITVLGLICHACSLDLDVGPKTRDENTYSDGVKAELSSSYTNQRISGENTRIAMTELNATENYIFSKITNASSRELKGMTGTFRPEDGRHRTIKPNGGMYRTNNLEGMRSRADDVQYRMPLIMPLVKSLGIEAAKGIGKSLLESKSSSAKDSEKDAVTEKSPEKTLAPEKRIENYAGSGARPDSTSAFALMSAAMSCIAKVLEALSALGNMVMGVNPSDINRKCNRPLEFNPKCGNGAGIEADGGANEKQKIITEATEATEATTVTEAAGILESIQNIGSGVVDSIKSVPEGILNAVSGKRSASKLAFTRPDACFLQKKTGPCNAEFERYYYNSNSKQCKAFIYGGCLGNSNNFLMKEECETYCIG